MIGLLSERQGGLQWERCDGTAALGLHSSTTERETGIDSLILVANLVGEIGIWNTSVEHAFQKCCYSNVTLLLWFGDQEAKIFAIGEMQNCLLECLSGGLDSIHTRDAVLELGMAYDAASW